MAGEFFRIFIMVSLVLVIWRFLYPIVPGVGQFVRIGG